MFTAATESARIEWGVNEAFGIFGTGGNRGDSRPAAYLNFILFDRSYNVLDAGWEPAPAEKFIRQKISIPTIEIKEASYIFIWLSYDNESPIPVYFDDLTITHTPTNVIQYNEYYPFGLQTSNSWTRENEKENNFLYNGGAELNATSSLYKTFFRTVPTPVSPKSPKPVFTPNLAGCTELGPLEILSQPPNPPAGELISFSTEKKTRVVTRFQLIFPGRPCFD